MHAAVDGRSSAGFGATAPGLVGVRCFGDARAVSAAQWLENWRTCAARCVLMARERGRAQWHGKHARRAHCLYRDCLQLVLEFRPPHSPPSSQLRLMPHAPGRPEAYGTE